MPKATQEKIDHTILSYIKWASLNPKTLLPNIGKTMPNGKIGRRDKTVVSNSCHTVYTRPTTSDGIKGKSLNDALRDLGVDPVTAVNNLITKEVIQGRPISGGFSITMKSPALSNKKGASVTTNAFLDKLFSDLD